MLNVNELEHELALTMNAQVLNSKPISKSLVDVVINGVCKALDVSRDLVVSKDRANELAEARFIIMQILYRTCEMSQTKVGVVLKRDHSTVINGMRRYAELVDTKDRAFLHKVNLVNQELGAL